MILTGSEIKKYVENGDIVIEPFNEDQLNPNSYNYRLGETLTFKEDDGKYRTVKIPEEGFVLYPDRVYLGHTLETLGSRNSTGRLGLFLQVSADLGHTGSVHKWTLELVTAKPFRVYPGMITGQISFWLNYGDASLYEGGYSAYSCPQISKMEKEIDTDGK